MAAVCHRGFLLLLLGNTHEE